MVNTFTCFEKFGEAIEELPQEDRAQLEHAICEYGFYGIEIELPQYLKPIFKLMQDDINHSISKRTNGGKGGRPKAEKPVVSESEKPVVSESEKPVVSETEKPVVSETEKPNTIQYSTIQSSNNIYSPEISEIVNYLNEKAGTSYRSSSKNTKAHIKARLKEGFTVQDFKDVIDGRIKLWAKDPRMSEYIRPDTLFGSKFESYLNAERVNPTQGGELDEIFAEYGEYYDSHAIQYDPTAGELAQVAGT